MPGRAWSFVLALLTMIPAVSTAAEQSEVVGVVSISPAHPGPQRVGEPSGKPFAGVEVTLRSAGELVVAHSITADSGEFRFSAPPGTYEVVVDTKGAKFPRRPTAVVEVSERTTRATEIRCDSGMR